MTYRRLSALAAVLASFVILTGCTLARSEPDDASSLAGSPPPGSTSPASTPGTSVPPQSSATPQVDPASIRLPELDDLVITTDGIGSLLVGQPVDRTDMVERVVDYCAEMAPAYGYVAGEPESDRWFAVYQADEAWGPFTVAVNPDSGVVSRIDVWTPEISTDEGVFVGDSIEILNVAYPHLQIGSADGISQIYYLEGESGVLVFEVPLDGLVPQYGDASQVGTVLSIRVYPVGAGVDFHHTAATGQVANSCV